MLRPDPNSERGMRWHDMNYGLTEEDDIIIEEKNIGYKYIDIERQRNKRPDNKDNEIREKDG